MNKPIGPHLVRVCCVCHTIMGYTPCAPENDGKRSHGYCDTCLESERARIREYKRRIAPPDQAESLRELVQKYRTENPK